MKRIICVRDNSIGQVRFIVKHTTCSHVWCNPPTTARRTEIREKQSGWCVKGWNVILHWRIGVGGGQRGYVPKNSWIHAVFEKFGAIASWHTPEDRRRLLKDNRGSATGLQLHITLQYPLSIGDGSGFLLWMFLHLVLHLRSSVVWSNALQDQSLFVGWNLECGIQSAKIIF